jgi:hypothetical protein
MFEDTLFDGSCSHLRIEHTDRHCFDGRGVIEFHMCTFVYAVLCGFMR